VAFLTQAELLNRYYKLAKPIDENETSLFLARANAWCRGYIGGDPPVIDECVKIATALCFEIMARGETSQIDHETGNITYVAPSTPSQNAAMYAGNRYTQADQFGAVKDMLRPYKLEFETAMNGSDRGVKFL
jgi:hypothetical protein